MQNGLALSADPVGENRLLAAWRAVSPVPESELVPHADPAGAAAPHHSLIAFDPTGAGRKAFGARSR